MNTSSGNSSGGVNEASSANGSGGTQQQSFSGASGNGFSSNGSSGSGGIPSGVSGGQQTRQQQMENSSGANAGSNRMDSNGGGLSDNHLEAKVREELARDNFTAKDPKILADHATEAIVKATKTEHENRQLKARLEQLEREAKEREEEKRKAMESELKRNWEATQMALDQMEPERKKRREEIVSAKQKGEQIDPQSVSDFFLSKTFEDIKKSACGNFETPEGLKNAEMWNNAFRSISVAAAAGAEQAKRNEEELLRYRQQFNSASGTSASFSNDFPRRKPMSSEYASGGARGGSHFGSGSGGASIQNDSANQSNNFGENAGGSVQQRYGDATFLDGLCNKIFEKSSAWTVSDEGDRTRDIGYTQSIYKRIIDNSSVGGNGRNGGGDIPEFARRQLQVERGAY